MKKINIAELLKDCPSGMELDCTLFDDSVKVIFDKVDETLGFVKIVVIRKNNRVAYSVTKYGQWDSLPYHKCVIFPKGKTTWEGFVPPCKFKDGDILSYQCRSLKKRTIYIYRHNKVMNTSYYVALSGDIDSTFMINDNEEWTLNGYNDTARLASEEEKQKLFKAIKDNGYRWNEETKTLEELPKFKDGDILFVESVYNWIIIYKESEGEEKLHKYVAISDKPNSTYMVYDNNPLSALCYKEEISKIRFATEEEKDKLFNVIKDNGYHWNEETKTLEKLDEPKFKDGDILYCDANDCGENDDRFKYVFIFDKLEDGKYYYSHCHLYGGEFFYDGKTFLVNNNYPVRFATEEEKEKLFKVMNYNGYWWDPETKTLVELTKTKFKPGDVLVSEQGNLVLLSHIDSENIVHYHCIIRTNNSFYIEENPRVGVGKCYECVLANEQQRQRMYDKIKSSGYEYNQSTNKLEKVDEPKFKDGDIVFSGNDLISIFKKLKPNKSLHSYVSTMHNGCVFVDGDCWTSQNLRLATEEEKEKLFKAISTEGYKWDPDTKTLLTVPIFKPGDRIKRKDSPAVHAIKMIDTDLYVFDDLRSIPICVQGDYELVPKKYDVNTLKPFDRVLVRSYDSDEWCVALWGHLKEKHDMRYDTTRGTYRRCIPYEGNEYLLGKTDDCGDYYKTW